MVGSAANFIDEELEGVIGRRLESSKGRFITVGTGVTSSHLGDERNLREFMFANEVVNYLRNGDLNVFFYLADDNLDPLDIKQLRIAVNKNEQLISKFEKYCGMPIKFIPDPFECHTCYANHFQEKILDRLRVLGITPFLFDSYSAYTSGQYEFAKEIVFGHYTEIGKFLKEKFPAYSMQRIFYPVCPVCKFMEGVEVTSVEGAEAIIGCRRCGKSYVALLKEIVGKFSWKIDAAIKWNLLKTDFEPFSKAYLDPKYGSYFIAKTISEKFLGGCFPEVVEYGLVNMEKNLSYRVIGSLPLPALRKFYLEKRRADVSFSAQKFIQVAKGYELERDLNYYDYVQAKLPYEYFEYLNGKETDNRWEDVLKCGVNFSKFILKKDIRPMFPTVEEIKFFGSADIFKVKILIDWVISYRAKADQNFLDYHKGFMAFLKEQGILTKALFPIIRKILSVEKGLPMHRLFYFVPIQYLYACAYVLSADQG